MDKGRFTGLWERCLRDGGADADEVFATLSRHYAEPHRRYHTPAHIAHCLRQFDLSKGEMLDPDAVEMALWFHDVIFDVPTTNNELRSAQLFQTLSRGRVAEAFERNVFDMIMVTTHQEVPVRHDDKLIVDVDLSSFALPWKECKKDSQNVRDEFAHKSDHDFYAAHVKFLQSLLARSTFFASKFFRDRYEASARRNVRKLIGQAKDSGFV